MDEEEEYALADPRLRKLLEQLVIVVEHLNEIRRAVYTMSIAVTFLAAMKIAEMLL